MMIFQNQKLLLECNHPRFEAYKNKHTNGVAMLGDTMVYKTRMGRNGWIQLYELRNIFYYENRIR